MKKLMTSCFAILFSVLAVLSCINYSYDGLEQIETDKQSITIEKPSNVTNEQFLSSIDEALKSIDSDIMYRYVDVSGDKVHYNYFKTNNSSDFISVDEKNGNIPLGDKECLSTTTPEGYSVYNLKVSSVFHDITFYNWNHASVYNLSSCTYYIARDNSSEAAEVIANLGYEVTVQTAVFISGKMSVVLFAFVPICLMIMSMAFYVLSNGKKNVLRKMEGYKSTNVLWEELLSNGKTFLLLFLVIELISICFVLVAFNDSLLQYIAFSVRYKLLGILTFVAGSAIVFALISAQSGSEHVKGKAPKKGMYYLTMLAKFVFIIFIVFFMSIAIRNVQIAHNTYEASQFVAEKVNGYVTLPIFENNASSKGLEDNYLAFYEATVDKFDGVLINSSNYELDVSSGTTLCEMFGQEEIVVNSNYLLLNPIYDLSGEVILTNTFDNSVINVLIPEQKADRIEKYTEFVRVAYSKEANFISYDGINTDVYSYNANTGTGSYGSIEQPIIIVVNTEDLEGIFVLSYCSRGEYFIKPRTNDPYAELLPILKATGIDAVTPQSPFILSNFDNAVNQQFQMLLLYGTQTLILSIGLACLILFSAKLYCENYKDKIACCLIEGYSLLRCIRQHVIVTMLSYAFSIVAAFLIGNMMQVSMNYLIILGAFIIETASAFIVCKKYTKANLCEIVKGAE